MPRALHLGGENAKEFHLIAILVPFLVVVRLERLRVTWCLLVVSLASVRHTCRFRNSLRSWFYTHKYSSCFEELR